MLDFGRFVDASSGSVQKLMATYLVVKDVCSTCNGGTLSALDSYGKVLYDRYFASPVYAGESITFEYDGDRLLRWLLKLSYNSARAQNADVNVLREYRNFMLGAVPPPDGVRCWLHLVSASSFDESVKLIRPARREEQGQPNVEEPFWFRIGQFRMPSFPAIFLVQRTVLINSFAFTLLVARTDVSWPDPTFDEWIRVFANGYPTAKPLRLGIQSVTVTAGDDHAALSMYGLLSNWESRFSDDPNPFVVQALKLPKDGAPLVMLHIPRELIEAGDTTPISSALCDMVSTQEKAAAFRHRVAILVDGTMTIQEDSGSFRRFGSFFGNYLRNVPLSCLYHIPRVACSRFLPPVGFSKID